MRCLITVLSLCACAVFVGCTTGDNNTWMGGGFSKGPQTKVVRESETLTPTCNSTVAPTYSLPAEAQPARDNQQMFLNTTWVLVRGAPTAEQLTFVCLHMPEAKHGNRAYTGKVRPAVGLPAGVHFTQVDINNHGAWITVWAVVPN